MVRPGLILYGMYPAPALKKQIDLKPVLSWQTRIIQLKRVAAGTSIGYGRTFVAQTKQPDRYVASGLRRRLPPAFFQPRASLGARQTRAGGRSE